MRGRACHEAMYSADGARARKFRRSCSSPRLSPSRRLRVGLLDCDQLSMKWNVHVLPPPPLVYSFNSTGWPACQRESNAQLEIDSGAFLTSPAWYTWLCIRYENVSSPPGEEHPSLLPILSGGGRRDVPNVNNKIGYSNIANVDRHKHNYAQALVTLNEQRKWCPL
jgi:hypothetical protein